MAKVGRPTTYTPELGLEICDIVSTSPKMLETLCAENEHWPIAKTVYKWRIRDLEFGQRYTQAKRDQIEVLVSDALNTARDRSDDFYEDQDGKQCINYAHLQRLRMYNDTIKWLAGKLAPKLYGERPKEESEEKTQSLLEALIEKL